MSRAGWGIFIIGGLALGGGCRALEQLGLMESPMPPRVVPIPGGDREGWERIGSSVRGKAMLVRTVGQGDRGVYVVGGVYGDEPEGPAVARLLPGLLEAHDRGALRNARVRVLMDLNPDGTAGRTRTNTRGVDLNRNWPSRDHQPERRHGSRGMSELETVAAHGDITAFNPKVLILFRSSHRGPRVSCEGGGVTLAYRFAAGAREWDGRWRVERVPTETTPGSLAAYGAERGAVILTVEFQRGREAGTNAQAVRAGILSLLEEEF